MGRYPAARLPPDPALLRWPFAGECLTCGTGFARFIPNTPAQPIQIMPTYTAWIRCSAPSIPNGKRCCECGMALLEDPWRKLIGNEA